MIHPWWEYCVLNTIWKHKTFPQGTVIINSISGVLGHHEKTDYFTFRANGKKVVVTVELKCQEGSENPCCVCAKFKTCRECRASLGPDCYWNIDRKTCVVKGLLAFEFGRLFFDKNLHAYEMNSASYNYGLHCNRNSFDNCRCECTHLEQGNP